MDALDPSATAVTALPIADPDTVYPITVPPQNPSGEDSDGGPKFKLVHCTDHECHVSIENERQLRGFPSTSPKYDKILVDSKLPAVWFVLMREDDLRELSSGAGDRRTNYPFRSRDDTGVSYPIDIKNFQTSHFIYKLGDSSDTGNLQVNYLVIPANHWQGWKDQLLRVGLKEDALHKLEEYSDDFVDMRPILGRLGKENALTPSTAQTASAENTTGINNKSSQLNSSVKVPSREDILPINLLNPTKTNWTIRGVCKEKSDKHFYPEKDYLGKRRSAGSFFNFHITDDSGKVRITGFNNDADRFVDFIQLDTVYFISGCAVNEANEQYNTTDHPYELKITWNTSIIDEDGQTAAKRVVINMGVLCRQMSLDVFEAPVEVNHRVGPGSESTCPNCGVTKERTAIASPTKQLFTCRPCSKPRDPDRMETLFDASPRKRPFATTCCTDEGWTSYGLQAQRIKRVLEMNSIDPPSTL